MVRLNNRKEKIRNILVPIIAVLLGFVLGGIIMAAFGYSPITGYTQMFRTVFINGQTGGLNARNIGEILLQQDH